MPVFVLHTQLAAAPLVKRRWLYDTDAATLVDEQTGKPAVEQSLAAPAPLAAWPGAKTVPIRKLKIQLGLSCNYACSYCSQRFVPHADATAQRDVASFLAGLPEWLTMNDAGEAQIEFWGGEPLAYWKTLRPLAEALRERYPAARFVVITNGSLLDAEKVEWLDRMGFAVAVSHDGPGQAVRGPDPLDNPPVRAAILDLYRRLAPAGRMSFNAMLNQQNTSRAAVQQFFVALTGDPHVRIGEGGFVDAYDEGGLAESLPATAAVAFRRKAFAEIRAGSATNFWGVRQKIQGFGESLRRGTPALALGQKCGMDRGDSLAVDLRGNVITCQNVSAAATAPNGASHRIGHVSDLGAVQLRSAERWTSRAECPGCPVLHLCGGGCMFLQDALWSASCASAYSDNAVLLAAAVEWLTGFLIYRVEHADLPPERQWLWRDPPI